MLKIPFLILISLSIAFFGGVYSTLFALNVTSGFGSLSVNGWTAYPSIQSADADPYAKAHRAKDAQILLGRAEGIKFETEQDSDGATLSSRCDYRLSGEIPPATFWTLRIEYADSSQDKLPKSWPTQLNSHKVIFNKNNEVDIAISSKAASGNWLATQKDRAFKLILTLIDTPVSNDSGIREVELPPVRKSGCS